MPRSGHAPRGRSSTPLREASRPTVGPRPLRSPWRQDCRRAGPLSCWTLVQSATWPVASGCASRPPPPSRPDGTLRSTSASAR
eukprot:12512253-Alexandrium_andersonii.AAC.1